MNLTRLSSGFHPPAGVPGVAGDGMSSPSSLKLHDDAWITSPLRPRPSEPTVEFVDEKTVKQCMSCNSMFTLVVKKHHCVSCGKVYCGKCSKVRAHSEQGVLMRQRFCIACEEQCASRSIITRGNQKVLWKQRNSSPRLKQGSAPPPVVPLDGSQPIQRRKSGTCSCSVHVQQPISATAILCTIKPRKKMKKAKETAVVAQAHIASTGRRSQSSNGSSSSSGADDGLSSRSISPVPLYGVCTTPTAVPLDGTADSSTCTDSAYTLYAETSYLDQTTSTVDCSVQCPPIEEESPTLAEEWSAVSSGPDVWRAARAVGSEERTLGDNAKLGCTAEGGGGQCGTGSVQVDSDGDAGVLVQSEQGEVSEDKAQVNCAQTAEALCKTVPLQTPVGPKAATTHVWRYVMVVCVTMVMTALLLRLGDTSLGLGYGRTRVALNAAQILCEAGAGAGQFCIRSRVSSADIHDRDLFTAGVWDRPEVEAPGHPGIGSGFSTGPNGASAGRQIGYSGQQEQEDRGAYDRVYGQKNERVRHAEAIAAGLEPSSTRLKVSLDLAGDSVVTAGRRSGGGSGSFTVEGGHAVRGSVLVEGLARYLGDLLGGYRAGQSEGAGTPPTGEASAAEAGTERAGGKALGSPAVAVNIVFIMEGETGPGLRRIGGLLRRLGRALWQPLREGVEDVDRVYL